MTNYSLFKKITILFLSLSILTANSAPVPKTDAERSALNDQAKNLGSQSTGLIDLESGEDVQAKLAAGRIRPNGDGIETGGMIAEIDETEDVSCVDYESIDINNPSSSAIIAGVNVLCYKQGAAFNVYACNNSLLDKQCGLSDYYRIGDSEGDALLLPFVTYDSLDMDGMNTFDDVIVGINGCVGLTCVVTVKYTQTLNLDGDNLDAASGEMTARVSGQKGSISNIVMGNGASDSINGMPGVSGSTKNASELNQKFADAKSLANNCFAGTIDNMNNGVAATTCDGSKTVSPIGSCTTVTTCAEMFLPETYEKTCDVSITYADRDLNEYEYTDYGQCRELTTYEKHCHDRHDYTVSSSYPVYKTVYYDCYQTVPNACSYQSTCFNSVTTVTTDAEGNVTGSTTTQVPYSCAVYYACPQLITNGCSYQAVDYYVYTDYIATSSPGCYFTGSGVSLSCGWDPDSENKILYSLFIMFNGRFPTLAESEVITSWSVNSGSPEEQAYVDAAVARYGNVGWQTAFSRITGRSPTSSESSYLSSVQSSFGNKVYLDVLTYAGSSAYFSNLMRGAVCVAQDRKITSSSVAAQSYNYVMSGNYNQMLYSLMSYSQN